MHRKKKHEYLIPFNPLPKIPKQVEFGKHFGENPDIQHFLLPKAFQLLRDSDNQVAFCIYLQMI